MAFKLHCDYCLGFIKTVNAKELKELNAQEKIICKKCQKAEDDLIKMIGKIKQQINTKIANIEKEIREVMYEELAKILKEHRESE